MVPEPSKLIATLRGATEQECEAELNRLIRAVERETAKECWNIALSRGSLPTALAIHDRFDLKEQS